MPEIITRAEPLEPLLAARVTDFARACKAATRAVSLYPGGHPAIGASLARLIDATARVLQGGPLTLAIAPGVLLVDQRAPARPDPAVTELAALLHEHLVGELRLVAAADADAWRSFLLLLAQEPAGVQAQGGITRLWTSTGGQHVQVREVDYAQVLRARESGIAARWDAILEHCLHNDAVELDDETLQALLDIAEDPARLEQLIGQLADRVPADRAAEQAAALLRLLRHVAEGVGRSSPDRADRVLANLAAAAGRLSPDVMLAVIGRRYDAPPAGTINVVDAMLARITDATVGRFVARSLVDRQGATERLAEAFQALVPETSRRERLLGDIRTQVAESPLGQHASFEMLWQHATEMLTSYKDESFVSDDYARELSGARAHAAEVERIADDPPELVAAWLGTITDAAVRSLDLQLQLDLLALEDDVSRWREVAQVATGQVEDLVLLGDFEAALSLVGGILRETAPASRSTHRAAAGAALDGLARGAFMGHLVGHLRTIDDEGFARAQALCLGLGQVLIQPLAEALAAEDRGRGFRRLTDLVVAFGSAGRDAAEKLKNSPNPAVRRTAVYLLREFGGAEALPDLTALLDDAEPNVQREAVRAIALLGNAAAFEVLSTALARGTDQQREAIVGALGAIRDDRAVPLFCHILGQDGYRRTVRRAWVAAVEGLGIIGGDEAVRALAEALPRGEWWAPARTAASRRVVAAALARIGTPGALQVLRVAIASGPRGSRSAARAALAGVNRGTSSRGRAA
jgi:hypothetical protein